MKALYTSILSAVVLLFSVVTSFAQEGERMIVSSKLGNTVGFWVNQTDSVKFLTDTPDLSATMTLTPIPGKSDLRIDLEVGKDVRLFCLAFPESSQIKDGMTDEHVRKVIEGMGPKDVFFMKMADPSVRKATYNLERLEQGKSYVGVIYGLDEYGCPGAAYLVSFSIPQGGMKDSSPIRAAAPSPEVGERMIVYPSQGDPVGFWVNNSEIKFLTDAPNLNATMTLTPTANVTGSVDVSIEVGAEVRRVCLAFPEKHYLGKGMNEEGLRNLIRRMGTKDVFYVNMENPAERKVAVNIKGLQRGYEYVGLIYGLDEYGCPGVIKQVPFTVPKGALKGNPAIEVTFPNIDYNSLTVKLVPNADCVGYFFLVSPKDNPEIEQQLKMFGIPDLKHYVILYGADFRTRIPHQGVSETPIKGLRPSTEYVVYQVMIDADGQYSDLIETSVMTKKLGTSETSVVEVAVSDITETKVTVTCTPDANTSEYRYLVVEKNTFKQEEMEKHFKEAPDSPSFPYTIGNDSFTWNSLKPGTTYYAVAMGKNGDGKWGTMKKVEFKTLGTASSSKSSDEKVLPRL